MRVRQHAWEHTKERSRVPVGLELALLIGASLLIAASKYWSGGWASVAEELSSYLLPFGAWGALYLGAFVYYLNQAPAALEQLALEGVPEGLGAQASISVRFERLTVSIGQPAGQPVDQEAKWSMGADMWAVFENGSGQNDVLRSMTLSVVDKKSGEALWSHEPSYGRLVGAGFIFMNNKNDHWLPRNINFPGRHSLTASLFLRESITSDLVESLSEQHEILVELDSLGWGKSQPCRFEVDWDAARHGSVPAVESKSGPTVS